jgi:CubicO group peptidase (beta-lactamase class C family)
MKRVIVLAAVLLFAVTLPAALPPSLDAQASAAISGVLRAAVARGDVPGVVAVVVSPDRVLYHEAFGKMNVAAGADMQKDSVFRIASMTKAVTSVGVMMLVEQGTLGLDDEVSKYLPAFKTRTVITRVDPAAGTYETRPATRPITIRHLLTHTSGIGYSWSDPGLAIAQKKTGATNDSELPLVHEPGEKWTYGANTRVLGDVVEKISGQRIDAYLESAILGPLGMRDTTYTVPPSKYPRVVTEHQKTNGKIVETPNPTPIPASIRGDGGLFSTAGDYARFLQMLLNRGQLGGTRVLKEQTVREMTRNQTGSVKVRLQPSADPARAKPYPLGAGEDVWGFGFLLAAPAHPNPNMRRPGSLNWGGVYNTFFWVDPEAQIGAIVLMQMLPFYDEAALRVLRGVEEQIYRHLN